TAASAAASSQGLRWSRKGPNAAGSNVKYPTTPSTARLSASDHTTPRSDMPEAGRAGASSAACTEGGGASTASSAGFGGMAGGKDGRRRRYEKYRTWCTPPAPPTAEMHRSLPLACQPRRVAHRPRGRECGRRAAGEGVGGRATEHVRQRRLVGAPRLEADAPPRGARHLDLAHLEAAPLHRIHLDFHRPHARRVHRERAAEAALVHGHPVVRLGRSLLGQREAPLPPALDAAGGLLGEARLFQQGLPPLHLDAALARLDA